MNMPAVETKQFATETKQILEMFAKWLYRDREIFIKELISNASDANDKLKTCALENESLYGDDPELKIWVLYDKEKHTVTIRDNGIGMNLTNEEKKNHLIDIKRDNLIDQVCVQEILPPED